MEEQLANMRVFMKELMESFNQKIDSLAKEVQKLNHKSNQEEGIKEKAADIPDFKGGNPFSRLIQMKSVTEYQSEFEELMQQVTGINEALLISFYISGLKLTIQLKLLIAKPRTLEETFELSHRYEASTEELGSVDPPSKPTLVAAPRLSTRSPQATNSAQPLTKVSPFTVKPVSAGLLPTQNTSATAPRKSMMTPKVDEHKDPKLGQTYAYHGGNELPIYNNIALANSWHYHLEDKVIFEEWRNVTPLIIDPGGIC